MSRGSDYHQYAAEARNHFSGARARSQIKPEKAYRDEMQAITAMSIAILKGMA